MQKRYPLVAFLAIGSALLAGCNSNSTGSGISPADGSASQGTQAADSRPDQQSNAPLLPDPHLTPGDADPRFTLSDVCTPGFTKTVRNVPTAVKRQVYAEYGITSHRPGEYEVDHLISLELGGSNSIKNLWPQSYETQPWNAHVKDDLENKLHEMICSGQLDEAAAQHDIATDWIAAYKKYFHTDRPLSGGDSQNAGHSRHRQRAESQPLTSPPPSSSASTSADGKVWVNTRSGKYFRPDSPYYGNTKQGEYLTETQAQQQGYTAAHGQ